MRILLSLLLVLLPLASFATDNTELLSKEPISTEPKFERKVFSSCSEFETTMSGILSRETPYTPYHEYAQGGDMVMAVPAPTMSLEKASTQSVGTVTSSTAPHSTTNTQVLGIDEPDTIKNDGKYLYLYSEGDKAVIILDAKTLNKVSSIRLPNTYADVNVYIAKNRLVVLASRSDIYNARWGYWYNPSTKSIVATYDVSDITRPKLERFLQIDGALQDSRLTDDGQLTMVTNTSYWYPPIYRGLSTEKVDTALPKSFATNNLLPKLYSRTIVAGKTVIQNTNVADCGGIEYILPDQKTLKSGNFNPSLTTILRFNITTPAAKPLTTVILSQSPQIHVSRGSLYLVSDFSYTTPGWACPPWAMCKTVVPVMSRSMTLVHRFALENTATKYVYTKSIAGSPLSQYSMDENEKWEFRIVTQNYAWSNSGNANTTELNIIAKDGNRIGGITNIAPGENFQSSRFIGDRLYLVTFQQIDPLFVIDVGSGASPKILGELKIPGYSTYLHPYDKDRLIGIGYDTFTNKGGGTQNGGIKVDLYNVADVKNPKQERSLVIGDVGSSSDALHNPRTFTWYKEKNLLLLPGTFTTSAKDPNDTYRLAKSFQWLVGLAITPQSIIEKFRITHIEKPATAEADWKKECSQYSNQAKTCQKLWDGTDYCNTNTYVPNYCLAGSTVESYLANKLYDQSSNFITRPLYVGDTLYTLSQSKIRKWDLSNPTNILAEFGFKVPSYQSPISIMR